MGRKNLKRRLFGWYSVWMTVGQSTTRKLSALLVLILLATGANVVFFQSMMLDFRDMAGTVSIAGKVRLLSQKIELDTARHVATGIGSQTAVLSGLAEFDTLL